MAPRGSKPGERRGGRKAGTPNKKVAAKIKAIESSGLTPLDYMLKVMRDDDQPSDRRDEMAKQAAPYVHPRLATTESKLSGSLVLKQEDALAALK